MNDKTYTCFWKKIMQNSRKTVVPVHGNEELGKGLLMEILKQIKLDREE